MRSESLEASVECLLDHDGSSEDEDVDFVLQKRRVEEAFDELLYDLRAFGRVEGYLQMNKKKGLEQLNELNEAAVDRKSYESFRQRLKEHDRQAIKQSARRLPVSQLVREVVSKVQEVAEKSLVRPESPIVRIKNRAEQESLHWARQIALQENRIVSLNRQIVDCERMIVERKKQRLELQERSKREMDDCVEASRVGLVETKLAGDGAVRKLQEQLSSLGPAAESAPQYLASLDQRDQKRKRIAKLTVQLQLWVKKYDKIIGEPMGALLELEQRMGGLEAWKNDILMPQQERLQQLQTYIDEQEAIALEEKIEEMIKLHAVRVLQRAWKRTLEIKRVKKSKKGKGKGKQRK